MSEMTAVLRDAEWLNAPPDWALTDDALSLTTGNKTDFWQDTFYGFRRDNGHFLGLDVAGDFTGFIEFQAAYEILYDQAGLMMRADAQNWVKAGIEYSDDVTNFSAVVTRDGRSDWSVISVPKIIGPQHVRLTRTGGAVIVHYLGAAGAWHLMRVADFPPDARIKFGPMACSPQRSGLAVHFTGIHIGPPIQNPLHAD